MELFLPPNDVYGPPDVFTDNIVKDFKEIYFSDDPVTIDELERKLNVLDPKIQKKLIVVTERVEFVIHLFNLRNLLIEHKSTGKSKVAFVKGPFMFVDTEEEISFHNKEFTGVDHDIDALCLYLLLTCIECIEGPVEFTDMAKWLVENWDQKCKQGDEPKKCINQMKNDYYDQQGARRAFKRAFSEHIPAELRERLITNFAIVKLDDGQLNMESLKKWLEFDRAKKVKNISEFLYDNVRSKFTHESHRSFLPDTPINQLRARHGDVLISRVPPTDDNLQFFLLDVLGVLVRNILE